MKMRKKDVDWEKVYRICRKGRQGRIQRHEEEYAAAAYAADPKTYGETARRARKEVDDELMGIWGARAKTEE